MKMRNYDVKTGFKPSKSYLDQSKEEFLKRGGRVKQLNADMPDMNSDYSPIAGRNEIHGFQQIESDQSA